MKRLRIACAIGTTALATACAMPWEVDDVQTVISDPPPAVTGPAFTRALFSGYRIQARDEALEEYDWVHAAVFARKALRAAGGEAVAPEDPAQWDLPVERRREMADAHAHLLQVLAAGAADALPEIAAEAQTNFDCWVEEEAEYDQGESLAKCRSTFVRAVAKLEPVAVVPESLPPVVIESTAPRIFEVYFDLNEAGLTPKSRKLLTEVAAAHADLKPREVRVIGHTDTVGKSSYNQRLSAQRAQAVATALAHFGIIAVQSGLGQNDLAFPTGEGVAEQRNRRVEIQFIR